MCNVLNLTVQNSVQLPTHKRMRAVPRSTRLLHLWHAVDGSNVGCTDSSTLSLLLPIAFLQALRYLTKKTMPHRPERPAGATAAATATYSPHHGAAAAIMRPGPQSAMHGFHPAGVVTPKPWMAAHVSGVPHPKSSDSADRSTGTKPDDSTVATLATEATTDEREATASALLMVSQGIQSSDDAKDSSSTDSNVPLKKRKKHLDFLRRNQSEESSKESDPCHVSPVSHSSLGSGQGRTVSSEEVTPERPSRLSSQRSHSYDSKEVPSTQALLASSKIHSTIDIAPPAHVMVPHFPSVLHQVLADPEYSGTVLQWLPDGEAWKVLRWDALRRQVLPRYFSDLRDENGHGSGTIDAFLWHLTAWGFEEVKDGTDVGAYRHDVSLS